MVFQHVAVVMLSPAFAGRLVDEESLQSTVQYLRGWDYVDLSLEEGTARGGPCRVELQPSTALAVAERLVASCLDGSTDWQVVPVGDTVVLRHRTAAATGHVVRAAGGARPLREVLAELQAQVPGLSLLSPEPGVWDYQVVAPTGALPLDAMLAGLEIQPMPLPSWMLEPGVLRSLPLFEPHLTWSAREAPDGVTHVLVQVAVRQDSSHDRAVRVGGEWPDPLDRLRARVAELERSNPFETESARESLLSALRRSIEQEERRRAETGLRGTEE